MQILKNKLLLLVIILGVAVGVGGFMVARQFVSDPDQTFAQDGYVLGEAIETAEGGYIIPRIAFTAGTPYSTNFSNELVFTDTNNEKIVLSDFAFLHYEDGSSSSFRNGVFMDTFTIAENENVICYNFAPGSLLQKNGATYAISHLGSELTFDNIAMKVGENNYLFCGGLVSLSLAPGVTFDSGTYIEVKIYDEGVIFIKLESGEAFYTVAPNSTITIDGRTTVNLSDMTVQNQNGLFSLEQLVIDSPDNFIISSGIVNINGVKIPEIIAEDGKEGEIGESGEVGEDGEAGEAGEPGTAGTEGTEGAEGAGGASGASGPAGAGSEVEDPGSGESPLVSSLPDFTLPILSITDPDDFNLSVSRGLDASISVSGADADDFIAATNVTAYIINTKTGERVWPVAPDGPFAIPDIETNDNIDITVTPDIYRFSPDVEYQLIVNGSYEYEGDTYSKDFFKRIFVGGDIGVNVTLGTVTSRSIAVDISKEAWSEVDELYAVLYGPDEFGVQVEIERKHIASLSASTPVVFDRDLDGEDLRPNTKFKVVIEDLYNGSVLIADKLKKEIEARTLLVMKESDIHVYKPGFSTSRSDRVVNVWPGLIEGLNLNSIQKYTYQFYEIGDVDEVTDKPKPGTLPVVEIDNEGRTAKSVNVAYAGGNTDPYAGYNYLLWNKLYKVRLVVEYSDNMKTWIFEGDFTEGLGISGALFPSIMFVPDMLPGTNDPAFKYDAITGTLIINTNGVTFANNPNDGNGPYITIQFRSTEKIGFVKTEKFYLGTATNNGTTIELPIHMQGLMQDSYYTMLIYGFVDFNDGNGGSLTHVGTVTVTDAGVSIGSLSALTTPANGFSVVLSDQDGESAITLPSATPNTGRINALFCLNDLDANISSEYEAGRLGEIEFDLYAGATPAPENKLGSTAKLASSNPIPGESTLGAATGAGSVYNKNPNTYDNFYILTEADFGLNSDALNGHELVTLVVRRATDYTKHTSWSMGRDFYNEFPLSANRQITLQVQQIMPPLPEANDALLCEKITEGNRYNYFSSTSGVFSSAELRPGYDPNTVIGFSLQARFGAASIANSFEYTLYRSLLERSTPTIETLPTSELVDANRLKVMPGQNIVVNKDQSSPFYNAIPKIIVLFGKKSDYDLTDTPDDATYYFYLGDQLTADEGDARGYSYYATYSSVLQFHGSATLYDYPADYKQDGNDHTNTILYSLRLSAPLQKPIIKTYLAGSTTGSNPEEIWNYRMLDIDNAFESNSFKAAGTVSTVVSADVNTLQSKGPVSPPDYDDTFKIKGFSTATPEGEYYTVTYRYKEWRYTDTSAPVSHMPPTDTSLLQWYHEKSFEVSDGASAINYSLFVNMSRNRLHVVFPNLTESSAIYQRLAAAQIRVTRDPGGLNIQKTYIVPVSRSYVYDRPPESGEGSWDESVDHMSAQIDLQILSSDFSAASGELFVEVSLFYDNGLHGFGAVSQTNYYTMQIMRPAGETGTGLPAGDYFARSATDGTVKYLTPISQLFDNLSFSLPLTDKDNASFSYNVPLENPPRTVELKYSLREEGALETVSGLYVVPKVLAAATSTPVSSEHNAFNLPLLVPEVYTYRAVAGLEEATVNFRVDGLGVLEGYSPATFTLELFRRDRTGSSFTDVSIGVFTDIDASNPSQNYAFYFGAATGDDVPAGYVKLPLSYQSTQGNTITGLETDNRYFFRLSGVINRKPSDTDTVKEYFFDHDLAAARRDYTFQTSESVKIGGDQGTQVTFNYIANTYMDKKIQISYPLEGPAREYYLEYVFTNSNGDILPIKDPRSVYTVLGVINTHTIDLAPGDSFFNYGETYTVKINARTDSTNDLIGESAELTYMLPNPIAPQYVITATPSNTLDGPPSGSGPKNYQTDISINPIDSSCSIAGVGANGNGQYIVRIKNSSGQDVTSNVTFDSIFTTSLADHVFSFNKASDKVQKFTISGADLPSATGYTLNIYAIVDAPFDGPPYGTYASIAAVPDSALDAYFIRAIEFNVHNENEINVGDVTISPQPSSTRLIFENQINLSRATSIQYSITNLGTDTMPIASEPIAFSMIEYDGGAYYYFDIPAAITDPGLYQIELRFTGPGVYREKTINFRRT